MMNPKDTEQLNSEILQQCINWWWTKSHPAAHHAEVDLCKVSGGDHFYGTVSDWQGPLGTYLLPHSLDAFPQSGSPPLPQGTVGGVTLTPPQYDHYGITCLDCGLKAVALIDISANGLDKIVTFLDNKGFDRVWMDPKNEIWYSHTKMPEFNSQGQALRIPY
jgi:hypothetical protein